MLNVAFERMRSFWQRERGAITVEFVVTLPILLAVLTFVQQYGEAMRIRNAMDIAVRDAARFIARAPVDELTGEVPATFICRAQQIIEDRMAIFGASTVETDVEGVTQLGCTGLYTFDDTGELATYDDGATVADTVVIASLADQVVVGVSYTVNLTYARLFAVRAQDVTWSVDGSGNDVAAFTARTDLPDSDEDLDRGLTMTVVETWPRTE